METIKKQAEEQRKISDKAVQSLKDALGGLQSELAAKPFKDTKVPSDGTIPSGKIVMKAIDKVFPLTTSAAFDIPVWEWDGVHPDVPTIDPHYIFREDLLVKALYAIVSNQRMYLQGHTGAGKTTLLEQIAAHLNWPFARINFDSEITRMDLIGRDTLKDGKSVFVDGVLPRLMQSPYIVAFDEIDFCRPDVAYVMQSVLEGNSFRITEDGGRPVSPDPMFRMFATGNTVGQGDEHGMYQGARPQSLAFLDRFTIWGKVDYLNKEQRADLLARHNPGLTDGETTIINKYVEEHLKAFQDAKILQPISPRGMLAVGKAVAHLNTVFRGRKDNMTEALKMTVLDRATQSDYAVIRGIIDRVVK
jgi:cobaltochelatase CobS subunit